MEIDRLVHSRALSEDVGHRVVLNDLLNHFQTALDRAGLSVPSKPQWMITREEQLVFDPQLIPRLPLLALAQHFGLPTPLLDWSIQSRTAAYFAAASAARDKAAAGSFFVWALRADFVREQNYLIDGKSLTLLTAPRDSNPNLHAQSGVFTLSWGTTTAPVDAIVEAIVTRHAARLREEGVAMPIMRCLSAPKSCAPKLLRLLSYEGVDGSSMFPGYEGVVRAMKERALWDEPPKGPKL